MNNNVMNKEAIQLLNAASDSDSASDLQFSLAPQPTVQVRRKIRTKRKQRKDGNGSQSSSMAPVSCTFSKTVKVACISFAIGGTLVLGWIVMQLHTEVQQLSDKLASLPTSYDDETILGLKRAVRELSSNQTYHYNMIQNYSKSLEDFRKQMTTVTSDVLSIKDSLKEAPQMLNIGKELDSLKSSLATYGATISDLKLSFNELKDSSASSNSLGEASTVNTTLQGKLDLVTKDLRHHHEMITSLQNATERLSAQIPSNLLSRVDAVQSALIKVEAQQVNTTLTLSYAMELIQQITSVLDKRNPGSRS